MVSYQGVQRSPLLLTAEEVAALFHLLQGADLGQTALVERSPSARCQSPRY